MESILVVDDEKNIRLTISEFLRDRKYTVHLAEDAMDAVEVLRTTPVDLVITDIMMPRMKGTDLLDHIREEYPGIKTILITGQASLENATASLRGGAFDYLQKPVTKNTLLSVVENACRILTLDRLNQRLMEENRQYREHLEDLVHRKSAHLTKLSQKIVTVQDDERREVAHEIERTIGQSLIALKLDLQSVLKGIGSTESDALLDHLDAIITRTRSMASTLDPVSIASTDLILVARRIREELGQSMGCRIEIEGDEPTTVDTMEQAGTVGLIIREAVTNAIRHGRAGLITIQVRKDEDSVALEIRDDGCGFAADTLTDDHEIGILLMQERTGVLHGALTIHTTPGEGSVVSLTFPQKGPKTR